MLPPSTLPLFFNEALDFRKGLEFHFGHHGGVLIAFLPLDGRDEIRLGAALVCIAVLCGVDSFFFGGQYATIVERIISEICRRW
jgi:hypothetical protein